MGKIFTKLWKTQEVKIIIQGLDAAGKTTALYRLKLGEVVTTIPTIGFNVESINYKNVHITAWDVGGRDKMRPLFRHYYSNADAILFVVDSNDRERIPEITDEMQRALNEDELRNAIICVIANKQDIAGAMTVEEISKEMKLNSVKQTHAIFAACAIQGEGLYEALDWLTNELAKRPTKKLAMKKTEIPPNGTVMKSKSTYSYFSDTFTAMKKAIIG